MLFLHAVVIPAPPPQLAVVVVTTDPRTPEQYDGLVVTQQKAAAVSKGKGKIVLMLSDKSDYEEGESVAQRFQRVQYNKKLAAKKASKAKAEAALAVASYNAVFPDQLMVAQYRSHLNIMQSTTPAIPQWDGWREISEDDHYRLLFKHDKERALHDSPEAKGLYYYIGMDPNQVHLWKRMAAHGLLLLVPTATNITPVESSVVAATTASGPSAPPGPVPASQEPATNIATGDVTMALESGEVPAETAGSGP
ncbi:hypothetical protein C0995_008160 [Termitomyces sp. Mi166|nr:hypothetical protein C0995_008160 [Termitomyces sp. Mi166\